MGILDGWIVGSVVGKVEITTVGLSEGVNVGFDGSDDEMAAAEKSGKPLSQAQKKKLKAKQKAEEEKKLAAET